ncbi:HNH endonuclease [Conexibacter woesei]|uniref:HNH endonuclease n=1 Tax=Conexibacter woesei TaxID=191495 RepID=UPI000683E9A2|nr:HNH endonuclease [Conexibacter woesei]
MTRDGSSGDREAVLGNECHIVARSAVGPRGAADPDGTVDDYGNLILLCANDHKLVDDQPAKYTPECLKDIKKTHEGWVDEALDWRAALTDAAWEEIRSRVPLPDLPPTQDRVPRGSSMLTGLALYTYATAEFLDAESFVAYVRAAGDLVLAYSYERGDLRVSFTDDGTFAHVFDLIEISNVDDLIDDLHEVDEDGPEDGAAYARGLGRALRDTAAGAGASELVVYFGDAEGVDLALGFRYRDGQVVGGAGYSGAFTGAFTPLTLVESFDITEPIRLEMSLWPFADMLHEGPAAQAGLAANLFAIAIYDAIEPQLDAQLVPNRHRDRLRRTLVDRMYEALLVIDAEPSKTLYEWALANYGEEPLGGLSAVLPNAAADAARSIAVSGRLSGGQTERLTKNVVDTAYELIGLLPQLAEEHRGHDALVQAFTKLPTHWVEPKARKHVRKVLPHDVAEEAAG